MTFIVKSIPDNGSVISHSSNHYEGLCSPHGPPPGDWIPGGYFEGFLVENCGYTYRMRWNNSGGGSLFKDLIPT